MIHLPLNSCGTEFRGVKCKPDRGRAGACPCPAAAPARPPHGVGVGRSPCEVFFGRGQFSPFDLFLLRWTKQRRRWRRREGGREAAAVARPGFKIAFDSLTPPPSPLLHSRNFREGRLPAPLPLLHAEGNSNAQRNANSSLVWRPVGQSRGGRVPVPQPRAVQSGC